MQFQLHSNYQPTGDQPQAITKLAQGLENNKDNQVLLGVTGSGKTFTVANVIEKTQKPTLVIAHNKTLAAQLYQEFRDYFPENAVSYFVSYYDYYQPEAYIPTTDTYIEKEAQINDEIDKLRLSTTANLLTRKDVIVVASVSCIYNLGNPVDYRQNVFELIEGQIISRETLMLQLTNLQYERTDTELRRGTFRVRGDTIQVWPAYQDTALKLETLENQITSISEIDPISGIKIKRVEEQKSIVDHKGRYLLYPAKHYIVNPKTQQDGMQEIRKDMQQRVKELKKMNKELEAYRLEKKVNYDLEMLQEFGFVNGIENYSRYFDGRNPADPPYTLIDYFRENVKRFSADSFLTVIDESHITLPQIKGMHRGDRSRKETLIKYGFRLPSALDNRPLNFEEFVDKTQQRLYVSATPKDWEIELSNQRIIEQLIRPTGLLDPKVELRPSRNQIQDLIIEIIKRVGHNQRVLVTTLTKRMSEDLTDYLNNKAKIKKLVADYLENNSKEAHQFQQDYLPVENMGQGPISKQYYNHAHIKPHDLKVDGRLQYPKVAYLHSEIETLDRSDILDDLRLGKYDVVVGINLLREGLDLPEVSLVAILDADKTGFLRSETALIQTMGRAARHKQGKAILYADYLSKPMQSAITETQRRRQIQQDFNQKHDITPISINKPIRKKLLKREKNKKRKRKAGELEPVIIQVSKNERIDLSQIQANALTPQDRKRLIKKFTKRMKQAARDMDFELAAILRDKIREIEA